MICTFCDLRTHWHRCGTFRQRLHFLSLCTCIQCPLMPQPHYHSTLTSFIGQIGLNWVALHKNGRYWDECQEWQMWFKISFAAFLPQLMHFLWMSLVFLSSWLTVASLNPRLWHRCERFFPPPPFFLPKAVQIQWQVDICLSCSTPSITGDNPIIPSWTALSCNIRDGGGWRRLPPPPPHPPEPGIGHQTSDSHLSWLPGFFYFSAFYPHTWKHNSQTIKSKEELCFLIFFFEYLFFPLSSIPVWLAN